MLQLFMFITGIVNLATFAWLLALSREVDKMKSPRIGGSIRATRQTQNGMIDIDLYSGEGR